MEENDIDLHRLKRKQVLGYGSKGKTKSQLVQDAIHNQKGYKQAVILVGSFGKTKQSVIDKVSYISQKDEAEIKDKSGEVICPDEAKEKVTEWIDDTKKRKGANRFTMNLTLQSQDKANPKIAEKGFKNFLEKQFPENEYIYAIHLDRESPHAHVIIKMQNSKGKKIQANKPELYEWRENFAESMREEGFLLSATSRQSRGRVGQSKKMGSFIKSQFYEKELKPSKERKHDKENIELWKEFYKETGGKMMLSQDDRIKQAGKDLVQYGKELGKDKQLSR